MNLYDEIIDDGKLIALSRQKIDFHKNSTRSLKQFQHRWNKYMASDGLLQCSIRQYVNHSKKIEKVETECIFYKSRMSEAYYFTYKIGELHKKLRIANHDTKDDSNFDESLWLHECPSMKTVYKGILRFIDKVILEWRNRVTIDNFDSYFNLALQKKQEYDTINKIKLDLINDRVEKENELKSLLERHKNYEDAIGYLKEIIELISRQHIDHIEKLLNSAVKTIFYDKNYSIKLEISEFRNNNALNIYLVETTDDGEITTDIKNNGFGIQGVIGFVLQVYFILYHKLSPILFMDEAMSTLSQQYIPYFKELVEALAKQYNFKFVLVAHDPRFIEISDYIYEVKDGEVEEVK